jgi:hypothetical protein
VAQCGISDVTVYMGRGREGRIHQYDGRTDRRIEVIVNVRCVVPRDRNARKQLRQEIRAAVGELVEDEPGAGEFSENGQHAGASRGFEHHFIGRGGRSRCGDEAERDWC